jgi:Ca-activated chloride channel family protein
MSFAWPLALVGLVLVPFAVAGYVFAERRRERDAEKFANPALLPNLVAVRPGRRRHVPPLLALGALTLLLVGLARPHATLSTPKEEATVMLALDVSRSMAAEDVQPNRFEAARSAVSAFLEKVPETYPVGMVAFSTKAEVVLPPTTDREAARAALKSLRLGSGTAMGEAITTAISAVPQPTEAQRAAGEEPTPTSVLLLSDGAQTAGGTQPLDAARRARQLGIPVSTVALGTSDAVVEVPLPGGLSQRVTVPPDAPTLKQVAEATGGRFFEAPDAEKLNTVYEDLGSRLGSEDKKREVTSAFAGAGALLLLAGGALSTLWFRRPL